MVSVSVVNKVTFFFLSQKHQESEKSYSQLCEPVIERARFLCTYLNPCHTPVENTRVSKWYYAVSQMKKKHGYSWNLLRWGVKFWLIEQQDVIEDDSKETIQEICKFIMDGDVNLDILRKCFLIEVIIWYCYIPVEISEKQSISKSSHFPQFFMILLIRS